VRTPRILVIEDGFEYTRALERIAADAAELVRAADAGEAEALLEAGPCRAVLLDVVFDRTPTERLAGGGPELLARFGGDRARATEHLAQQQGFYIADALAPRLAESRVLMAYDFSGDPARLEALRERLPGLEGIREGTGLDDVLARLLKD
jgi:CheY-like chemotaxis protein